MLSAEQIFNIASFLPGPLWLALACAPSNRWTQRLFSLVVIVLAALYAYLLVPDLPSLIPVIAQPQLETIAGLLRGPSAIAAVWAHIVIGDLFIGRWLAQSCEKMGMSIWLRLPLVLGTVLFAPLGIMVFALVQFIRRRRYLL